MDNQLLTLSKIFTERLFRIPDYQRGYAWQEKQVREFWTDLLQIPSGGSHYTGVLTLEKVSLELYKDWSDDLWVIQAKNYEPYFVVDGQQRLTTALILVQVILEQLAENRLINFTEKRDIRRKFVFDSKDGGISRSYIFGYEKDNPSESFLRRHVFGEEISSYIETTAYTGNLERAKSYFKSRIVEMDDSRIEEIFTKVTQHLLFNIFEISTEVEVCVAFETMNNRGKPLSTLELLKNRLIYLTLKLKDPPFEREKLRREVNVCWRAIYHRLGQGDSDVLYDDDFLANHYVTYFGNRHISEAEERRYFYRRLTAGSEVGTYLLENIFVTSRVIEDTPTDGKLGLVDIYTYVRSLRSSIDTWANIRNPLKSSLNGEIQLYLDKLNRIGVDFFLPFLLTALESTETLQNQIEFLKVLERYLFIFPIFSPFGNDLSIDLGGRALKLLHDLKNCKLQLSSITKILTDESNKLIEKKNLKNVADKFRFTGYYTWPPIRYFLFEYNLHLQSISKTSREKIFWPEFVEDKRDFVTIEHIYPQRADDPSWKQAFGHFHIKQRNALKNSLGNLLPLSKPKNSSLSNRSFNKKARGESGEFVSYKYGSYAENEVSGYERWDAGAILERGLKLIDFMEKRWRVNLGDRKQKISMLGLAFLDQTAPR